LDVAYSVVSIENYLSARPIKNLPLDVKFGFIAGITMSKTYQQEEDLVEPGDAFFTDGSKVRNKSAGDLPDPSSFFLGLGLGAKYDIYKSGNFIISPEIQFVYGLISPVKSLNWNVTSIKGGISVQFNIPKASEIRHEAPPFIKVLPEPATPPSISAPVVRLKVFYENKQLVNNDTISVDFRTDYYYYIISQIPVLYYSKNSLKPESSITAFDEGVNNTEFLNVVKNLNFSDNYASIISEYLKNNPGIKIEIITKTPDEDDNFIKSRIEKIRDELIKSGISSNTISINSNKVDLNKKDKVKYKELVDESRNVTFKFSNNRTIIEKNILNEKVDYKFNKSLAVIPEINVEAKPYKFNGYKSFNDIDKSPIEDKINDILLTASLFEVKAEMPNKFRLYAEVSDSQDKTAKDEVNIFLTGKKTENNSYKNMSGDGNFSQFILGYFKFDESGFFAVDKNVLEYVKQEIKNGKKVNIIPSTDYLGTTEYNKNLADIRARSAIKLLNLNSANLPENVEIVYSDKPLFNNSTSYGRNLNRCVIVNIEK
jgi:outer membrane protein OmpA-like peptidoglycan-associated protein